MPSFVTHSEISRKINSEMNCCPEDLKLKVQILDDYIAKMSLGHDLTYCNARLFHCAHERYSKYFFYQLIMYIKNNKLYDDSSVMSFLYGQITHYVIDQLFHPYIYYIEKGLIKTSIISPHQLIEWTIDELVASMYNTHIQNINNNYIISRDIYSKNLKKTINHIYNVVFDTKMVYNIYRITEKETYILAEVLKKMFKKGNDCLPPSILNSFLQQNGLLDLNFISNSEHNTWYHPISGEEYCYSVYELIEQSKRHSLKLIEIANRYIYGYNNNSSILLDTFKEVSYDTGKKCNYQDHETKAIYTILDNNSLIKNNIRKKVK